VSAAERVKRRRARARAEGKCVTCCTRTPAEGRLACQRCVDAVGKRERAARAAGVSKKRGKRPPRPTVANYGPHVPGAAYYYCIGYKRRRGPDGLRSHRVTQIWSTERLCLECMARKDRDDGYVPAVLTVEEDRADELLALSYGAIAARCG
jgi:hypothetical protein